MALVGYKQRECSTCGGHLVYHKDTKEYECTYCGNRYDKTESYDGQFSVRHAAQQVLSALASRNMELVEENLNDCQKIDPSYPGTIIAQLMTRLNEAGVAAREGDSQASNSAISRAIHLYKKLPPSFDEATCEDEADFYENIDSADIRSLLIRNFRMLKDSARVAFVEQSFQAESIHGVAAAKDALIDAVSNESWEKIDALLESQAKLDTAYLIESLLSVYPDCDKKIENVGKCLSRGFDKNKARKELSSYLETSRDSFSTKTAIVSAFASKAVAPPGRSVALLLSAKPDDPSCKALLSSLCVMPQNDEDVGDILSGLFNHASSDNIVTALDGLSQSSSFLSFSQETMLAMLLRDDLSLEQKMSCFDAAAKHGMTEKRKQALFGDVLSAPISDMEAKIGLLDQLGQRVSSVNPVASENYLLRSTVDAEGKPLVLQCILKFVSARGSLEYSAKRYLSSSVDPIDVHNNVIMVLVREGLIDTADNLGGMISTGDTAYVVDAAREMKQAGVKMGVTVLSDYLDQTLGTEKYDSSVFLELYSRESRISPELFVRFIFDAPDVDSKSDKAKMLYDALTASLNGYAIKVDTPSGLFEGPVLHAYLLKTTDGVKTVDDIAKILLNTATKPNMEVTLSGKTKKFKKLVQSGDAKLANSAKTFCSSIRLA